MYGGCGTQVKDGGVDARHAGAPVVVQPEALLLSIMQHTEGAAVCHRSTSHVRNPPLNTGNSLHPWKNKVGFRRRCNELGPFSTPSSGGPVQIHIPYDVTNLKCFTCKSGSPILSTMANIVFMIKIPLVSAVLNNNESLTSIYRGHLVNPSFQALQSIQI